MSGPESAPSSGLYQSAHWRLIVDTTSYTGAWNMALDETIMEAVSAGSVPPTLRFYQWEPPCISLGKRQPLTGISLERCRKDGVDIVRRATGGLAILHTNELTYSLAADPEDPRAGGAILDSYRKLSQGLVCGLSRLGVHASMHPVTPGGSQNASAACFEAPSAYELTASGRKLMGSAQTRPYGKLLQHGSLPLSGDIGRLADYLELPDDAERTALSLHLRQRATTLEAVLGRPVSFTEAARALAQGFAEALNLDLDAGTPSAGEIAAAEQLAAAKALVG
ncbi:MAG: biotin/lipoate A/B protein ligase family protein [Ktedonobacterales bacterium]